MRLTLASLLCLTLALPALAEGEATCEQQLVMVSKAVDARAAGFEVEDTRTALRSKYDEAAADALVDFVYSVPEEQVSAIKDAYMATCQSQ